MLRDLLEQLLGGGAGGGNLLTLVAIGLAIFAMFKKPAPAPAPQPAPQPTPSPVPAADVIRAEIAFGELHSALASAGDGKLDPDRLLSIVQTVIKFWPILTIVAGLLGIRLPPLPPINLPARREG